MVGLKKKPVNRRLGRERVLDVKLRSSKLRARRTRMVAWSLGTCFSVVLVSWLLWSGVAVLLEELVYRNKAFALKQIDLQTDGVLSLDQLKRWSGVKLDENLIYLDLNRVERNLKLIPWIENAYIERILPGTLRIRVTERVPVAQITVIRPNPVSGVGLWVFLVDAHGWVMQPLLASHRAATAPPGDEWLPVLGGISAGEVQPGRRLQMPQIQAALRLIAEFDRSPMAGLVDLKRIDVSAPEALVVTTLQGSEITFGLHDLSQQLRRWREIFDPAQRLGKAIATLDLAVSNNIPMTLVELGPVHSTPPRPPKTTPSRKRHV
jgi:cell division protein FtsQ